MGEGEKEGMWNVEADDVENLASEPNELWVSR